MTTKTQTKPKTASKTARKDADTPEVSERTVTVQGLKVTVSTDAMTRLDVVEALDDVNSERNPFAIVQVFRIVFGEEQYADVKKHLEEKEDGPVGIRAMRTFFESTLKKVNPNS
ncbi:hypothetical protein ACTXMZ_15425 [Brachybacterium alimentarium]|uniref:hypothetical protein n=1 Tax=Brachybacterium alimentarium TaxID=47845 RepID=UPI003FD241FE